MNLQGSINDPNSNNSGFQRQSQFQNNINVQGENNKDQGVLGLAKDILDIAEGRKAVESQFDSRKLQDGSVPGEGRALGEGGEVAEEQDNLNFDGTRDFRRVDYAKLNKGFKNLFNKDFSNINDHRRNLLHCVVFVAVAECIAWELDCLFLNVCYGEDIEMIKWVSAILFPLIIINLILLYFLYVTANYLKRTPFLFCIIFIAIIGILSIVFGIYQIVKAPKIDVISISDRLTSNEKEYYELIGRRKNKDDSDYVSSGIKHQHKYKMLFSGIMNLILGVLDIIIVIISLIFKSLLDQSNFDWRPPLRSHVRESRIRKAIDLYLKNNEPYKILFMAENPGYQFRESDRQDLQRLMNLRNTGNVYPDNRSQDQSNSNAKQKSSNIGPEPEEEPDNNDISLPKAHVKQSQDSNIGKEGNEGNNINNENNKK